MFQSETEQQKQRELSDGRKLLTIEKSLDTKVTLLGTALTPRKSNSSGRMSFIKRRIK